MNDKEPSRGYADCKVYELPINVLSKKPMENEEIPEDERKWKDRRFFIRFGEEDSGYCDFEK